MAHAIESLDIHYAEVSVSERDGILWLTIPAPRVTGDDSSVRAYLTAEKLRQLRDDIDAVLARLGG